MISAKHLSVVERCMTALAPRDYMVGVHFLNLPMLILALCLAHRANAALSLIHRPSFVVGELAY